MNEIQKYEGQLPVASIQDLQTIGKMLEQSGMFGCSQEGQGMVLAMTCVQERMSPLKFIQTYHIIEGKPSMRSDAMLARFMELGGIYKILARDAEKAEISLKYKEAEGVFALTWEDIKKEPFVYKKDGKTLKTNWATPRSRMQMLWARVISDAIRAVCPIVNSGSYTPEEMQDFDDNPTPAASAPPRKRGKTTDVPDAIETTAVETPAPDKAENKEKPKPEPKAEKAKDAKPDVKPENADPSIMPVGKHAGKQWIEFPTELLKQVLTLKNAAWRTSAHVEAIQTVLAQREQAPFN